MAWLQGNRFPTKLNEFLMITDNEVLSAIQQAAKSDNNSSLSKSAKAILTRQHFRKVHQISSQEFRLVPDLKERLEERLREEVGEENVRTDDYSKETSLQEDFPLMLDNGEITSAQGESSVVSSLPPAKTDYIFVAPEYAETACEWIKKNLDNLKKQWIGEQNACQN